MAGTRVLRVNVKAVVGLMRWPFPEGTRVFIKHHKLPDDCTFLRIVKLEEPYWVHCLLTSTAWHGHSDVLIPPSFGWETEAGKIVLPTARDLAEILS